MFGPSDWIRTSGLLNPIYSTDVLVSPFHYRIDTLLPIDFTGEKGNRQGSGRKSLLVVGQPDFAKKSRNVRNLLDLPPLHAGPAPISNKPEAIVHRQVDGAV